MRFRELTLRPLAGSITPGGEARVYRVEGAGKAVAILRGGCFGGVHKEARQLVDSLRKGGFDGVVVGLHPTEEFTLCEVEDGAPARWKEDGRPSYQDLEKRVKELESQAAMGSGADCAPCTVRP